MALSLDYMGRYILMMIAVLVAIGFIFTMRGQINDFIGDLGPDDNTGVENVKVGKASQSARASKISDLIETCYKSKIGSGVKDMTCYLITKESGSFDLDKEQITNFLSSGLADKVTFESDTYDRETIIVSYDSAEAKIIVEKP